MINNEFITKIHNEIIAGTQVSIVFAGVKKKLTKEKYSDINRLEKFVRWNIDIERKTGTSKAEFRFRTH